VELSMSFSLYDDIECVPLLGKNRFVCVELETINSNEVRSSTIDNKNNNGEKQIIQRSYSANTNNRSSENQAIQRSYSTNTNNRTSVAKVEKKDQRSSVPLAKKESNNSVKSSSDKGRERQSVNVEKNTRVRTSNTVQIPTSVSTSKLPTQKLFYKVTRLSINFGKWSDEFPVVLEGLVDPEEFHHTITQINAIRDTLKERWYYKDTSINSMLVAGMFTFVPMIPAIALSEKRESKLRKKLVKYFETINPTCERQGYKWVVAALYGIYISFTRTSHMTQNQKLALVSLGGSGVLPFELTPAATKSTKSTKSTTKTTSSTTRSSSAAGSGRN